MATKRTPKAQQGIRVRHSRSCATRNGDACDCSPTFEAWVYIKREGKKLRKTFPSLAAAKAWRAEALVAANRGRLRAPKPISVKQAWEAWYAAAKAGTITNRKRKRYRPSALRGYERAMRLHVVPVIGDIKLSELRRRDVQDLVDLLDAAEMAASTVANALDPLRRMCRRAVRDDDIAVNPCDGIELRPADGRREPAITDPSQAGELLDALPEDDRALWATAAYAALRRGELRAMRVDDVDLAAGVIRVRVTWDDVEGEQDGGKSEAAIRTVPIFDPLRPYLLTHLMATGRRGADLLFGPTATKPFDPSSVMRRAMTAWGWKETPNPDPDGPKKIRVKARPDALDPFTLHELRHVAVSIMVASNADRATLIEWVGHADLEMLDHYTHAIRARTAQAVADVNRYFAAGGDRA